MTKVQRQHRISEILERDVISTAAQVVEKLQAEGVHATQATVARDLQDLGAVKIRDRNGSRRLSIPESNAVAPAPTDHLRRMMGEWAISIEHSGNLIVIRTPPGCAHVVASALDRSAVPGVLGTVAGDDTILIIATEDIGGTQLSAELRSVADLPAR